MNVVIIGSGPGGYVAAIRCAQLGMQVKLIEKYDTLGGTCLNVGCIPSKALLDSSEHYYQARNNFKVHGIQFENLKIDLQQFIQRKNDVVSQNVKGISFLMNKNKIEVIHGVASFENASSIKVLKQDGTTQLISFDKCIIATGSKPQVPAKFNYDKNRIISSTEALNITTLPESMTVIGAGVIGLELGSVYARLGTQVTIVEYMDRILPGMDLDCAKELQKSLSKTGITFHLNRSVSKLDYNKKSNKVKLSHQSKDQKDTSEIESDYCLIAIGRRAYTDGLNLDHIGVQTDEKNKIIVDKNLQTTQANIFAIGDVIHGPMLAHKAEEEGVFVAEFLAGQKPHIDSHLIPGVVYTWPEMAGVGFTEDQLIEKNRAYKVGKFPFKALGRA
ncbi:MAG: dihydrolipoyl dehydrogenase, partial [Saprospiraceae bacterium]